MSDDLVRIRTLNVPWRPWPEPGSPSSCSFFHPHHYPLVNLVQSSSSRNRYRYFFDGVSWYKTKSEDGEVGKGNELSGVVLQSQKGRIRVHLRLNGRNCSGSGSYWYTTQKEKVVLKGTLHDIPSQTTPSSRHLKTSSRCLGVSLGDPVTVDALLVILWIFSLPVHDWTLERSQGLSKFLAPGVWDS